MILLAASTSSGKINTVVVRRTVPLAAAAIAPARMPEASPAPSMMITKSSDLTQRRRDAEKRRENRENARQ